MKVPFLDLKIQYESIKHEIGPALQKVLETTAFSGGPMVSEFEQNFAHYCQVKHALGVSNGTEAIWIVLKCMDIGYGDDDYRTQYLHRHGGSDQSGWSHTGVYRCG